MGRIKTSLSKRAALTLYRSHKNSFKPDFEFNKKVVPSLIEFHSKKLKNIIAGYITRLVKKNKD